MKNDTTLNNVVKGEISEPKKSITEQFAKMKSFDEIEKLMVEACDKCSYLSTQQHALEHHHEEEDYIDSEMLFTVKKYPELFYAGHEDLAYWKGVLHTIWWVAGLNDDFSFDRRYEINFPSAPKRRSF